MRQVQKRPQSKRKKRYTVVATGVGRNFLASNVAESIGIKEIVDIETILDKKIAAVSPSAGVTLMIAGKLEGKKIPWKQY